MAATGDFLGFFCGVCARGLLPISWSIQNENSLLDFGHPTRSPCIDAGNSDAVPADVTDGNGDLTEPCPLDVDGRQRFFDNPDTADTGAGTGPTVDIVACEYGPAAPDGSADLDHDGDVDMDDLLLFQQRVTGPQ